MLRSTVEVSDPGTTRTFDPQLRRLLLYPLSYGAGLLPKKSYKKILFYNLQKCNTSENNSANIT